MATKQNLFDARREELTEQEAPLAARMRPRTLDEFIGQEHIVGPGACCGAPSRPISSAR